MQARMQRCEREGECVLWGERRGGVSYMLTVSVSNWRRLGNAVGLRAFSCEKMVYAWRKKAAIALSSRPLLSLNISVAAFIALLWACTPHRPQPIPCKQ